MQFVPAIHPDLARRVFLGVLAATLAIRAILAAIVPLTGDEAYFWLWGREPAWGYYDHPPMVGWWLALLDALSSHRLVLRLPALLVPVVLALMAVLAVRRYGEARAWLAGSLVLVAPLNAWNFAITTDIPLMFFAGIAVLAYARAQRTGAIGDFLLCGIALGAALMSKYFAGLVAIAIFAHSIWRPDRRRLLGLALIVVASLPAAAIQIAWNAGHCWPNVMFNLVNRHDDAGLSWRTPLLFLATAVYALSPPVALAFWRRRAASRSAGAEVADAGATDGRAAGARAVTADADAVDAARDASVYGWLAVVPLLILALLSPVKTIGLHWLASFVLPGVLWFAIAGARDSRALLAGLRFGVAFAALHYVLAFTLAALPTETYAGWRQYPGLVMTVHADELEAAIGRERLDTHVVASNGYSAAVTLEYNFGRRVVVFGPGSSHARHDDIRADFRAFDGRDFLIVRRDRVDAAEYRPFFDQVEIETVTVRGAEFTIVTGRGFGYAAYRDAVLERVRAQWYQVPSWLPVGDCYFCDRYFPDRACHRDGPRTRDAQSGG
jgi:hypothetical protein